MDRFDCPECATLTIIEVTEDETHDGETTYMGVCVEHGDVSVKVNWFNP